MSPFVQKEIKALENPSKLFVRKRTEKGQRLEQVSKEIGISVKYLTAMEAGEWQLLPGDFYIKTFAKKYAEFLGIRWKRIEQQIIKEAEYYTKSNGKILPPKVPEKKIFFDFNSFGRAIIVFLIILAFLVYLYFQVSYIIRPPEIEILTPPTDVFYTKSGSIVLAGRTDQEIVVHLNNTELTSDDQGFFSSDVNLSPGINIIKVTAKKRYSKLAEKEISIVLQRDTGGE